MKFLIDAQLPRRLCRLFEEAGHEVIHTLDLPHGNRTTDEEILKISLQQQQVIITKDVDFLNSFILRNLPRKLLLLSTGNIRNHELEALFAASLQQITEQLKEHCCLELTRDRLIIHQ